MLTEQVIALIERDGLRSGDRLPTVQALATRFRVAAPTMREVLRRLQAVGVVEMRHGSGVYVRHAGRRVVLPNPYPGPLNIETLLDLLDARLLIEPHLAELAADADDEAIAELATLIDDAAEVLAGTDDPTPATLAALADLLTSASERFGSPIWLLADEPYARLVFSDAEFHSPSEFYPYTLIAYSYGKVLLTPGERIGWLAISPSIPDRQALRDAIQLAQVAGGWLFPNAVLQYAIADLETLSIDLDELEGKRDRVVAELLDAGYQLRQPEGTFYLWVRSPDPDDLAFCRRLADHRVLVLPGTICEAPGHFRISLTGSPEMIDNALPGFRAAITEYRAGRRPTGARRCADRVNITVG